jgi:hypothetical protein
MTLESSPHRFEDPPSRWRLSWVAGLAQALCLPLLALGSCSQQDGFQCGVPLRNDDDTIGRCSRNLEVCMCATLSCAVKDVGQFPGPAPEERTAAGAGAAGGSSAGSGGVPLAGAGGVGGEGLGGGAAGEGVGGELAGAPPGGASSVAGSAAVEGGTAGTGGTLPQASNICMSGYRYVARPFASADWAGKCVPEIHKQTVMVGTQENPGPLCPTFPPTPAGAGGGGAGGMSTSGAGGMSTSGAGGMSTSGAGGMSTSGAGGMSGGGVSGNAPVGGEPPVGGDATGGAGESGATAGAGGN